MKFEIEGLKEIEAALEEIAKTSTRTAVMGRALAKAAGPMRDMAKQYAPIDQGELESKIEISARAVGEAGRKAYASSMRETGGDRSAALAAMRSARRAAKGINPAVQLFMGPDASVRHSYFVEFGTGPRINGGRFAGSEHPGTAPEPFMRPAFDAEAQPTIDRLAPMLWSEIEKSARRVAKRAR